MHLSCSNIADAIGIDFHVCKNRNILNIINELVLILDYDNLCVKEIYFAQEKHAHPLDQNSRPRTP